MAQISYGFKTKKEDGTFSDEIKFASTTDLIKDSKGAIGNRIQILEEHGLERIIIEDTWYFKHGEFFTIDGQCIYESSQSGKLLLSTPEISDGYVGEYLTITDVEFNLETVNINNAQGILNQYLHENGASTDMQIDVFISTGVGRNLTPGIDIYKDQMLTAYIANRYSATEGKAMAVECRAPKGYDILPTWIMNVYNGDSEEMYISAQIIITRPLNK